MTKKQIKAFYREFGRRMKLRFVGIGVLSRLLGLVLRRVPLKYTKRLPGLPDIMRPMYVRFGKLELVLLSFDVGDSTPRLFQLTVAVHEGGHGDRFRRFIDGGGTVARWYQKYYTDEKFRAIEEGLACAASAEFVYALYGVTPKPPDLGSYLVSKEAVETAAKAYQTHIDEIRKLGPGGSTFRSSRIAIEVARKVGILT